MVSEHKVQTLGLDEAQLAFYETVNLNYFANVIQQRKLFLKFNNGYGKAGGICGRGISIY